MEAALQLFAERGYEGTSVADLAQATELSKAAFVYHFDSKEALLFELAGPFLDELDAVLHHHSELPADQLDVAAALQDYLDVLHRHRAIARWIDGDKSILNHPELGKRLDTNNRLAHRLLAGARPSGTSRALASSVLGMLWRPIRNGYLPDDARSRRAVVTLASQAAQAL